VAPDQSHGARVAFALLGTFGDERGRILRASRGLAEMLATTPAQLSGTGLCELVDPRDRDRALHELSRLVSGAARSFEGEWRLRGAGGAVARARVEAGLLPAAGASGEIIVVRLVEVATLAGEAAACG
jgi:PAS domain-containing protein